MVHKNVPSTDRRIYPNYHANNVLVVQRLRRVSRMSGKRAVDGPGIICVQTLARMSLGSYSTYV